MAVLDTSPLLKVDPADFGAPDGTRKTIHLMKYDAFYKWCEPSLQWQSCNSESNVVQV